MLKAGSGIDDLAQLKEYGEILKEAQ